MAKIFMHINYFEHGYTIAETFDKAMRYHFDGVELRVTPQGMSPEAYANAVRKETQRTGCRNVVFGVPCDAMQKDPAARRKSLDNAIAFLKATADVGCRLYNTYAGTLVAEGATYRDFHRNGSACATEDQWRWAVDAYQELGDAAESVGVRLAFETHNCYIHDLAKPTRELLRRIDRPSVGANLDMGNIVLNQNGESVADAIELLKDRIYYVHLKNMLIPSVGGYIACGMGDGVIDHRAYLRQLKSLNYDGPICLESPRQGDHDYFAACDIAYIKSLCEEIDF